MYTRGFHTRTWGRILVIVAMGLVWGALSGAQEASEQSYFVDGEGVPTLTNQPNRYRRRAEFREVKFETRPILIAKSPDPVVLSGEHSRSHYFALARRYAELHGVDEAIVVAIIRVESNFDPKARSRMGARGLMQLMPATAAELNVRDIYDPEQNIAAGTLYLANMMKIFNDDIELALAAYNAGPGTVRKFGGIPPYRQTRNYVRRVQEFARKYTNGDMELIPLKRSKAIQHLAEKGITPKDVPPIYLKLLSAAAPKIAEKVPPRPTPPPEIPRLMVYFTNGVVLSAKSARVDGYNYYLELDTTQLIVPRSHIRRIVRDAKSHVQGPRQK